MMSRGRSGAERRHATIGRRASREPSDVGAPVPYVCPCSSAAPRSRRSRQCGSPSPDAGAQVRILPGRHNDLALCPSV